MKAYTFIIEMNMPMVRGSEINYWCQSGLCCRTRN